MPNNKFWMCWNGSASSRPTVCHQSKEDAEKEAYRLTQLYGVVFYVLEAISAYERTAPPVAQTVLC